MDAINTLPHQQPIFCTIIGRASSLSFPSPSTLSLHTRHMVHTHHNLCSHTKMLFSSPPIGPLLARPLPPPGPHMMLGCSPASLLSLVQTSAVMLGQTARYNHHTHANIHTDLCCSVFLFCLPVFELSLSWIRQSHPHF